MKPKKNQKLRYSAPKKREAPKRSRAQLQADVDAWIALGNCIKALPSSQTAAGRRDLSEWK